tara:strand:+ start:196 stop:510 length:315 start_codon:yes stop_codon:yes gene_type:complete
MNRRKRNKPNNKYKLYLFLGIFLISSFYILTNDFGLMKLVELKREQTKLEREIHQLTKQQINLNNEISDLKTNTEYIEKIAREKFMMAKPGEKVFKVIQYKQIN